MPAKSKDPAKKSTSIVLDGPLYQEFQIAMLRQHNENRQSNMLNMAMEHWLATGYQGSKHDQGEGGSERDPSISLVPQPEKLVPTGRDLTHSKTSKRTTLEASKLSALLNGLQALLMEVTEGGSGQGSPYPGKTDQQTEDDRSTLDRSGRGGDSSPVARTNAKGTQRRAESISSLERAQRLASEMANSTEAIQEAERKLRETPARNSGGKGKTPGRRGSGH